MHQRQRRTLFICFVLVLMSGLSAVGLILCPSNTYYDGNPNDDDADATRAYIQFEPRNITNSNGEKEINVNVYLSATIHHNITINANGTASNLYGYGGGDYIRQSIIDALNLTQAQINLLNNKNLEPFEHSQRMQVLTPVASGTITENFFPFNRTITWSEDSEDGNNSDCAHPEYIVFTWVLCLVSLATALKLYFLIKTLMAMCMVGCYTTLICFLFNDETEGLIKLEQTRLGMPLGVQMLILLAAFLALVCYHARLVEVNNDAQLIVL